MWPYKIRYEGQTIPPPTVSEEMRQRKSTLRWGVCFLVLGFIMVFVALISPLPLSEYRGRFRQSPRNGYQLVLCGGVLAIAGAYGILKGRNKESANKLSEPTPAIALLLAGALFIATSLVRAAESKEPTNSMRGLVSFNLLTRKPEPLRVIEPVYPKTLKARKVAGFAVISFIVDEKGVPRDIKCVKATDPAFGESAKTAVSGWLFTPAQLEGKIVATRMELPIKFAITR